MYIRDSFSHNICVEFKYLISTQVSNYLYIYLVKMLVTGEIVYYTSHIDRGYSSTKLFTFWKF